MNKELYEQAKRNILKCKEEEFQEEVQCEYESLLYESQLVTAKGETLAKIKDLHQRVKKLGARSMGDGYMLHGLKSGIEDMAKTGKYNPTDLKKCEKEVVRREGREKCIPE